MKKIFWTILALCLLFMLPGCGEEQLRSDQDFINYAMKAEKNLYGLVFRENPDLLNRFQIKPSTAVIRSKQDLEKELGKYWESSVVDSMWAEGSKMMPQRPFGFYSDVFTDCGLLEAKDIKVTRESSDKVIVSGHIQQPASEVSEGVNYTLDLVLTKSGDGWKASAQAK
jgi:hypothetical protein